MKADTFKGIRGEKGSGEFSLNDEKQGPSSVSDSGICSADVFFNPRDLGTHRGASKSTQFTFQIGEQIVPHEPFLVAPEPEESPFSQPFLRYKTAQLIQNIRVELARLSEVEKADGLIYVSRMVSALKKSARFLDARDENRSLVGLLQILFEGDAWETLSAVQIRNINADLERFAEGDVEAESFNIFSRQLYRCGISPL